MLPPELIVKNFSALYHSLLLLYTAQNIYHSVYFLKKLQLWSLPVKLVYSFPVYTKQQFTLANKNKSYLFTLDTWKSWARLATSLEQTSRRKAQSFRTEREKSTDKR